LIRKEKLELKASLECSTYGHRLFSLTNLILECGSEASAAQASLRTPFVTLFQIANIIS
jgi:hypothetical protein